MKKQSTNTTPPPASGHYYTEPYKEKSLHYVDKVAHNSGHKLDHQEFSSKELANEYLRTVNILVDNNLMYSGV